MTRRPPHHALRATIGVAVMAALWLAGPEVGGLETGLLFLAPAFVVLLPLLAGRYPGERVLLVAFERAGRPARPRPLSLPRPPARLVPRGGLLVGCSLAGRAPPLG
jgi:hypothetical protein